jgi:tetratricopeptide (TPR) repeat protein
MISIDKPIGELIGDIDETVKGSTKLSREEYLLAEFRVLVTYLRLIFLPVNQNLDYDYSRYYSFFNIEVFSSFIFLTFIFGLSVYILLRYKDSAPHTRLISFGIIWFFINLLIESSIIPLSNVIYEHRMYLPSAGVFSALSIVVFMVIKRWDAYTRVIAAMLAVIIIVLTGATYARNNVWKDDLTLWQDVVNKSPNKANGHYNLGTAFRDKGLNDKAIKLYRHAIKLDPNFLAAHFNLGETYQAKGLLNKAIMSYETAIKVDPVSKIGPYYNLATAYSTKGLHNKAIQQYRLVIGLKPAHYRAHTNLGLEYEAKGLTEKAITHYKTAITLKPDEVKLYNLLGNAYISMRHFPEAVRQFKTAIRLDPALAVSHHNLGVAYRYQGDTELAITEFNNALRLWPGWVLPLKELEQINKKR